LYRNIAVRQSLITGSEELKDPKPRERLKDAKTPEKLRQIVLLDPLGVTVELRTTRNAPPRNHPAFNGLQLHLAELHALGFCQLKKLLGRLACTDLRLQLGGKGPRTSYGTFLFGRLGLYNK
jgi:hypothetical protein